MGSTTNGTSITHEDNPEDFVDKVVEFPDGSVFERLESITDLRKDPGEGRVLYVCKQIKDADTPENNASHTSKSGDILVMKIKAQWPGPQNIVHAGPSAETAAELKALQRFRENQVEGVPHLITWKKGTQPTTGIHPGGYIIYIIMTRLPGTTLWDCGYWGMPDANREYIQQLFLLKLRTIQKLGIKPYDCALRNILWDPEMKQVSIVDFEHYEDNDEEIVLSNENTKLTLQSWGLVSRPPPRTWFQEWGLKGV